jgi:hypothetical protein
MVCELLMSRLISTLRTLCATFIFYILDGAPCLLSPESICDDLGYSYIKKPGLCLNLVRGHRYVKCKLVGDVPCIALAVANAEEDAPAATDEEEKSHELSPDLILEQDAQ